MPRKISRSEYLAKAAAVHGCDYDYSPTQYVNSRTKINVKCLKHGEFQIFPGKHLQGNGCPKCFDNGRLTLEEFVDKANSLHLDAYDYSNTHYENARKRVSVYCSIHGDFSIIPSKHLQGDGCPECCSRGRLTHGEFVERLEGVHGLRYTHDKLLYVNARSRVTLTCAEHGDFSVIAGKALQGSGCPVCSPQRGFNPSKSSYTYFLLDTETYSRVKIGVSNIPDKRLSNLKKSTPFSIERIDLFETPPEITLLIEKFCHSQMESSGLGGFDGATEWFKFDGGKLEALREFIKSCGGRHV